MSLTHNGGEWQRCCRPWPIWSRCPSENKTLYLLWLCPIPQFCGGALPPTPTMAAPVLRGGQTPRRQCASFYNPGFSLFGTIARTVYRFLTLVMIYTSLFTKLVVERKICEKTSIHIYTTRKKKRRKKNSEQMFSYYILHIQLHTMMTDTLPLLW